MSAPNSAAEQRADVASAVAALGDGALHEAAVVRHVHPLFSRALAAPGIYLSNHSLGRPLDRMADDVAEGLDHWYRAGGGAWRPWLEELARFRHALATLLHAPAADCLVPKTSAGQGLRAVLNCLPTDAGVVSTEGEFDSLDCILQAYADSGRIRLTRAAPDGDGRFDSAAIAAAVTADTRLVVVSMVMYRSGQLLDGLDRLAACCHARDAWLLLDLYHAAGALPVDLAALDADFAVGGCYKYLRGGPGAAWLYVSPRLLEGQLRTPDTGWFALADRFAFSPARQSGRAAGGDAWLESTPAVLPWYQARAGLAFTLAVGVERLRAYNLQQQAVLRQLLAGAGIDLPGDPARCGAFLTLAHPAAEQLVQALRARGISVDARQGRLRICPDVLTTRAELVQAAQVLAGLLRAPGDPRP